MAVLYQEQKENKKAIFFYKKALGLAKDNWGKTHQDIATIYNSLAILYHSEQKHKIAYQYIQKAFNIFSKYKQKNFTVLDRKERKVYSSKYHYKLDNLLYLTHLNQDNKSINFSNHHWLNYKGTLFEYQNILSMLKENPKTPKRVIETINRLNRLNLQLSTIEKGKNTKQIEQKIHHIEIDLSKENHNLKSILQLNEINSSQIANELQNNQLYIDIARTKENYYIFTIDKNNSINFQQIDKRDSQSIDQNIKAYRLNTQGMADKINKESLQGNFDNYSQRSNKKARIILSTLYNLLIKTHLKDLIKEKTHLIFSADGLLNYLPFEALYSGKGYLIEDYTINYISSGKEFIRQKKLRIKHPKNEIILFANANFDASIKGGIFGDTNQHTNTEKSFSTLKDREISIIKKYYTHPIIFKEENATVKNLMQVESSKILHLSTHGIILNDKKILNPMRKALLIFAGANENLEHSSISALQLSALDLKDTELVVLSACQSGLGDIQNAEGVVGLPKALLQAGAKNVIMSLWTVSNQKTAMLMDYFYDNISKQQNYSTALQNAKIKMIKLHPYYWSSFILSGL